jgi:hypothetical protein
MKSVINERGRVPPAWWCVRSKADTRELVEALALQEQRPAANMIRVLVAEALKARGHDVELNVPNLRWLGADHHTEASA